MQKQETTIQELQAAKSSIAGRLKRLRKMPRNRFHYRNRENLESPIAKIGVFSEEIDSMEKTLESMQNRLDNAKITIEI